jgi:hypothetical protein
MTNALPKHIADMCGIVDLSGMDLKPGPDPLPGPERTGPIATRDNGDGTLTVSYFGRDMGHMTRAKTANRDAQHWIAVTVNGDTKRCFSQHHARCWIIENSF